MERRLEPEWHPEDSISQALGISEECFRILMETIPAGAFIWDGERTVYVNCAAARISGYSREELMSMEPWALVHPDSLPRLLEESQADQRGEPIAQQYEIKILTKSGAERWVHLTFEWVHFTAKDSLMIGTAFDITERKLAEEALRRSEARYRILYQDNPSMYFTVDEAGMVLDVNYFGAEQLGYFVHELIGKPVLGVFHEEDKASVERQLRECLREPGRTFTWQFRKVRKDGTVIWVEEVTRATFDAEGRPIVLIVCEDITQQRQLEEELVLLREELEQKAELAARRRNPYALSFRELTVLQLVVDGKADKEIAAILGITRMTASKHVGRILRKLKVKSRTAAGVLAVREELFG